MMASGVSITPATVPALAPSPATRASVAPSPGPGTPGSITSKEWVIPPRPKPGRKPATDTPPTKRKAQNRAAQRAFRERRAARVQELEEQMKEVEDGHDVHVASFREQISLLSREIETSRDEVKWWRDRCHSLEQEVSIEKTAKEALMEQLRDAMNNSNKPQPSNTSDSVPLPPRTRSNQNSRMEGVVSTNSDTSKEGDQLPLGCTDCSSAHCQCIEDAFGMPIDIDTHESYRHKHPPHGVGSPERELSEPEIKPDPEEMEIDFTARFAGAPVAQSTANVNNNAEVSSPPVDPCGFCQDGTPCICAEMAAQAEQRRGNSFAQIRLAPIQSISQFTPPPSDSDVTIAYNEVKLPPLNRAANPCANGPGTCAQCLADPQSTLFCKSLAASCSSTGASSGGGCCGGKGADGGCCMSRNAPANPSPAAPKSNTPNSLTLSCADAFTTLSRHPNYSRASDEISTWIPKLHPLPNPQDLAAAHDNRAAMEIEAASVMGVLRYFDRRFADK